MVVVFPKVCNFQQIYHATDNNGQKKTNSTHHEY